jgi:LPS sulfotransferase NodH
MIENHESIQLINTAIIKGKERKIDTTYEERLTKACNSSAISAISDAISKLAETENISYDQAAISIVETIKELDKVWNDYVLMEGINNIKRMLKNESNNSSH